MSHHVSVKDRMGNYNHHEVPKEVYIYVKQLEAAGRVGDFTTLSSLYPHRFKSKENE